MKKIKFRGKRADAREWVYGSLLMWENGDCEIITQKSSIDCDKITVIPDTVGQFAGLLDKNGKEIYEGDILGFDTERKMGYQEDGVKIALSVVFGRANPNNDSISEYMGFWAESSFGNRSSISYQVECHGARVIGNIHDNPELLEGGKP